MTGMAQMNQASFQDVENRKAALRADCLVRRGLLPQGGRERIDREIYARVIRLPEFTACDALFSYVSFREETDTHRIINYALAQGKTVAVPRCITGTNEMEFFKITALGELRPGFMGLPEPERDERKMFRPGKGALCLLPGLCFDVHGNHLGYGKGFYDRFLDGYRGVTAGLCRSDFLYSERLPCGAHDKPASIVVTERAVIRPV